MKHLARKHQFQFYFRLCLSNSAIIQQLFKLVTILDRDNKAVENAGFEILEADEAFCRISFSDVGAFVWSSTCKSKFRLR